MTSQAQPQFRYLAYNITSVLFSGAATGQCGVSWHPEYGNYPEQTQTATHRDAATSARCYFSWIFTERWSAFSLFSVKIHGTLKCIFANFREDSRNIDVGLRIRYFPWKLYCVLRLLYFGPVAIFNSSSLLISFACYLSVCLLVRPSVTLVDHDRTGWKCWKLTAWTISPRSSLFVAQRPSTCSQGNIRKFWGH